MKIWVASKGTKITPMRRRFLESGQKLGIDVVFPDLRTLSTNGVETLQDYDLPNIVVSRIGAAAKKRELRFLEDLEKRGCFIFNRAASIARVRDKYDTGLILAGHGLDIPEKLFVTPDTKTSEVLQRFSLPVVLKPTRGSKGNGVQLIKTSDALETALTLAKRSKKRHIFETFIASSKGRDLRVFVVAGRAVGSMQRVSGRDDFRANIAQGGHAQPIALDERAASISVRAATLLGLDVAGVDLLFGENGRYPICEVNGSPGFSGIESAQPHLDVARIILEGSMRAYEHSREQKRLASLHCA